jgi:hypothetical protein
MLISIKIQGVTKMKLHRQDNNDVDLRLRSRL